MPSLPLAFGLAQNSGVEEMGGAAPLSSNVMADAGNAVRTRPGIVAWDDFPTPPATSEVLGMVVYGDFLVYVTADRKIHAWEATGLVRELSDATAATQLDGSARPTFAVTTERVTIAGGGLLQSWAGTGLSARLGGSPPSATHVVGINTRLVVNVRANTGQIQWSEPGAGSHETWPAINFMELEARPDPLPALFDDTNELIGLGTETLQFLVADAVRGFVTSRALNVGTRSPYAFCQSDEFFRFLDAKKRLLESDGRSLTPISSPSLTKTLRDLVTVDDAWAFHLHIGAYSVAVWVFPTEGRAFAYNAEAKSWSEWRGWSASGSGPVAFSSYCYFPAHDLHLVGTSTGHIRKLDLEAYADLDDPLVADMVTGFQDRGSKKFKINEAVRLTFRHTPGTTPRVALTWRDDTGAYGQPIYFDVTRSGTVEIRSLGTYREREWRLTFSDDSPLTLVDAVEDYLQLES